MSIRVTIVGGGTIGYRLLQTGLLQSDMHIVGITKRNYDDADGQFLMNNFRDFTFPVSELEDKVSSSDVVVDCTDKASHILIPKYRAANPDIKVIIQGGEQDELADLYFNSYLDYDRARESSIVKVNSCNDTNFMRIYHALNGLNLSPDVDWTLCRRAADPKQSAKGPVNAVDVGTNTHHARDVMKTLGHLNISSNAYKASFTEMHTQIPAFYSLDPVTVDDIVDCLRQVSRIVLVDKKKNGTKCMSTTAEIREYGRKLAIYPGRFGDIYETVVWQDLISVNEKEPFGDGRKLYKISIPTAVHQESIVVPDNLDAIRALCSELSAEKSIELTDLRLSIGRGW